MWRKIVRWVAVAILMLLTFTQSWRGSRAQSYQYFAFLPIVAKPCPVHSFIQDGGMEAGAPNPHWAVSSSQFSDVLDDSPDPAAHTGAWKAWMGGNNNVTEVISQTFAIPAGVTQLTLRYWVWIDTQDGAGGDTFAVQLRNAAGGVIATLDALSDASNIPTWTERVITFTAPAASALQLAFLAQTDALDPTSFFVDDVSLNAVCN